MFLEPESHEYIFVLPLDKSVVRDRDTAEVVIQSQFAIKKSPFKGFECSGTPREGGISNKLIEIKNSSATLSGNNINHKGGNTSGSNMTGSNHNDTGQGISAGQGHSGNADDNRRKINKYIKSALWCILILAVAVALGYCVNEKFIKSNTSINT